MKSNLENRFNSIINEAKEDDAYNRDIDKYIKATFTIANLYELIATSGSKYTHKLSWAEVIEDIMSIRNIFAGGGKVVEIVLFASYSYDLDKYEKDLNAYANSKGIDLYSEDTDVLNLINQGVDEGKLTHIEINFLVHKFGLDILNKIL